MHRTTRREFSNGIALAAAAAILGVSAKPSDAEPPPETTRLRLVRYPYEHACLAPQWVAEGLLRAEGFTDIEYVMTVDLWRRDYGLVAEPGGVAARCRDRGNPCWLL